MSNISTVYDGILTRLAVIYSSNSDYTLIPDPKDLTNNKEIFLRKGYGLRYDGSSVEESEFNQYAMNHVFTVITTREALKLESQTTPTQTIEKQLLEDVYLVQQDFYGAGELGIGDSIRKVDLVSNSEVLKIDTEKEKFRAIETSFNFLICESF